VVRADAGLHADQARRHIGQACFDLTSRPLLPKQNSAAIIKPDDMERVLAKVDSDHGNRGLSGRWHGVLLVWAPLTSLALAGQEHGRTIPLADMPPRVGGNFIVAERRETHIGRMILDVRPSTRR
jgi:hypothetical protein